jgi:hypothetical protein
MSQVYLTAPVSSSPAVPTSFVTQDGTAVPVANVLIINGLDSTENNANGIITKGGVVGTGTANEVDVVITNRLQGSGSTVGAVTTQIATMPLGATPGNYAFQVYASGYTTTGPAGTAYSIVSSIRTNGATATLIATSDETFVEDASLAASDLQVDVSGNNVVINATGIVGITIDWNVVCTYIFIG